MSKIALFNVTISMLWWRRDVLSNGAANELVGWNVDRWMDIFGMNVSLGRDVRGFSEETYLRRSMWLLKIRFISKRFVSMKYQSRCNQFKTLFFFCYIKFSQINALVCLM